MPEMEFNAIIWKEDELFVSLCPQLDVSSFGKSPKQAMENLEDAVRLYMRKEPKAVSFARRLHPILKSFKIPI